MFALLACAALFACSSTGANATQRGRGGSAGMSSGAGGALSPPVDSAVVPPTSDGAGMTDAPTGEIDATDAPPATDAADGPAPLHDAAADATPDVRPPVDGGSPRSMTLDPAIKTMLGEVSESNLSNSIQKLAGFTTRNTCSDDTSGGDGIGAARDWIRAQLAAIPELTVALHAFTYAGCGTGTVTRENVVAWKPGQGHPDRLIVIGGHYDSRTLSATDGKSPAPGANDSGSQTALVLEVARVLAGDSFDATLVFVAFAGEEQGLVGSRAFATGYHMLLPASASVEAMFNNDIVGGDSTVNDATTLQQFRLYSPGTPREIKSPDGTTDDTSPARNLMRFIALWGAAYVPTMTIVPELREDRMGRGGDHESFLDQGVPAVRFIETIESPNAGTTASHKHSPNDLFMHVTPAYTARIAQVVISSVATVARAPSPPQALNVTGTAASGVMLSWSAPLSGPAVDHYVIAARATTENLYRPAVRVAGVPGAMSFSAAELGISAGAAFFVSIAAVDAAGHQSLFAYPEYRCDTSACAVQAGSLDVTTRN